MIAAREVAGHSSSLCAKHTFKAMQDSKNRSGGEITGSLTGVEVLVHQFARARTKDRVSAVLKKVNKMNQSVARYLKERRKSICAYYFLLDNKKRGGRITDQMVESFNSMVRLMRQKGPIGAILWLNKWFINKWAENCDIVSKYKAHNSDDLKDLAPKAAAAFRTDVLDKMNNYRVTKMLVATNLELKGVVQKTINKVVTYQTLQIIRKAGCLTKRICPCRMVDEYGHNCGGLVALIRKGNTVRGLEGNWIWNDKEFFAPFMHLTEFEKQSKVKFVELNNLPKLAELTAKGNSAKSILKKLVESGPLKLVPMPILATAGRPKVKKNGPKAHGPRLKSLLEVNSKSANGAKKKADDTEKRSKKKSKKVQENEQLDAEKEIAKGIYLYYCKY